MKRLLLLYPRAWRERYQDEMEVVLDDVGADLRTALDLVGCAVDAHLNPRGGGRSFPRGLPLRVALLAVLGVLMFSALSWAERPVLTGRMSEAIATALLVVPIVLAGLAALASRRAGWRLGAVFWAFVALQSALEAGLAWEVLMAARALLEPVRAAVAGRHPAELRLSWVFAAVAIAGAGALIAAFLRRLDVPWPAGLAIGLALVTVADFWTFWSYAGPDGQIWAGHPGWFRLQWFWLAAQLVPWAALAALLLRRDGAGWPAALVAGGAVALVFAARVSLFQALVDASNIANSVGGVVSLWLLPTTLWAAVLAALTTREAEPAAAGAAPVA